ncbi:MAG TPA: DUF4912 domain-containing protein [bacterium]|nr:DUF4912 domain-containing protein [bacterium]
MEKLTRKDFEKMSLSELLSLAEEKRVKGWKSLNKAKLVEAILKLSSVEDKLEARKAAVRATATAAPAEVHHEEQKIAQSKYYVGPAVAQTFKETDFVFPQGYGVDKIVLLVRDPYWMHTYWEITWGKIQSVKAQYGDDTISQSRYVLRVLDVNNASPDKPNSYFDVDVAPGANSWYINVPNPNCAYCVDIGFLTRDGKFILLARSNVVMTPRAGVSDVFDEQWMTLEEYDKIYALSGGLNVGLSSGEIRKAMKKKLESLTSSGFVSSGAVSSFSRRHEEKKRGFFLVVDTELILYGVTMPDAKLTIQGVPKKLNPDGTFSARFALPDGKQVIQVKGISSDDIDEITITPIVTKETTYDEKHN